MAERRVDHENPFRVNSPRNVLLRARERFQLVSEWLKMRREDSRRTSEERERDSGSHH